LIASPLFTKSDVLTWQQRNKPYVGFISVNSALLRKTAG
jgi:hypothetical protein